MERSKETKYVRRRVKTVLGHLERTYPTLPLEEARRLTARIYVFFQKHPEFHPERRHTIAVNKELRAQIKAERRKRWLERRSAKQKRVRSGLQVGPVLSHNRDRLMIRVYGIPARLLKKAYGEDPSPRMFPYVCDRLLELGQQFRYDVAQHRGIVIWMRKGTREASFVFGISDGARYWAIQRLWQYKNTYRVAVFYDEENVEECGNRFGWLKENQAKMTVLNLTDPRIFFQRLIAYNEKKKLFTENELHNIRRAWRRYW